MADSADGASADSQITFKVKTSGDRQHTITMAEAATVADLKTKLAGADFEDIPPERQRLIYSGRVMKNEEPLSTYKIKPGNTVHLVKSAASNPAPAPSSSSASAPAAPQIPTNMAAGTANNPLAGLTGARYAGLANLPSADMFGPDGGMVGSMMDENQLASLLDNPNVAQQMNEMMNNDQFLDMMIQSNPMLRDNPNAREMVRSPLFRQMMTNPEALRSAARLQRMMRGSSSQGAFPMPGVTDTTPGTGNNNSTNNSGAQGQPGAFDTATLANLQSLAGLGGPSGSGGSLYNLFGMVPASPPPPAAGSTPGAAGAQTTTRTNANDSTPAAAGQGQGGNAQDTASAPPNPFANLFGGGLGANPNTVNNANPFGMPAMSPEALQQMMQLLGMGGSAQPAAAPDNRPPEERYAEQLRQLNDMGFYDFDRNVAALRRSGGSVQGAIEHLLGS
ncbi:putative deubiquitination-protection protein dph1 [Rosellinia necatrix]|uniref:Putative deubiquitination-protection protein dph1 n=1 Tax=Rosellinia necatrix TaxID=77044 RepID=A0A1W2TSX5_ROSNE|nr:putative deubiquitination-protection protein dph1 [Rosellinia necatrix]